MIYQPRRALQRALIAVALAVTLALAGCTGGGGASSAETGCAVAAAEAAPAPAATPEATVGSSAEPAPEAVDGCDHVTFLTALGEQGRDSYGHVASAKGFFAEENLRVTIQPGEAGEHNNTAIAGGAAQFAIVDSSGAFIRYAEGDDTDFRIVAAIHQRQLISTVAFEESGISRETDLEGRTMGLVSGSIAETLWPAYADLAGIDADLVEDIPTNGGQQTSQLVGGRLDAMALFAVGAPGVQAAGAGRPVVVLPWSEYLEDLIGAVLITSLSLAEDEPELVERFGRALIRGLEYALAHPDEAGQILAEAVPETNPEAAAEELRLMAGYVQPLDPDLPIGSMTSGQVNRAVSFLESIGVMPASGLGVSQEMMAWQFVPGFDEHDLEGR